MKNYFTADTHLNCENLWKQIRPDFSSLEEHDEAILDGINSTVERNDHLTILGDFCWKKPGRWRQLVRCRHITYILGNHDKRNKIEAVFGKQVYEQRIIKGQKERFLCCHYPMAYWDRSHYGMFHLYGHLHDNQEHERRMNLAFPDRRSMDVGVDAAKVLLGEYRPFSEETVLAILSTRKGHGLVDRR
jgi:calcineurin-like phosphoesterase family protein